MEGLPNEIIKAIIGFLDKDDLLSVRLLNKTFQIYAEEYLKTLYFEIKQHKDVLDLKKCTSWRFLKNTFPTPFVRFNVNPSCQHIHKDILKEFSIAYDDTVQSLRFAGEDDDKQSRDSNMESINKIIQFLASTSNIQELYVMKKLYWADIDGSNKLCLPKLRILEFKSVNLDLIKLIINAATNVQEVKLKIAGNVDDEKKWKDCLVILQSIANRGIVVKLKIYVETTGYSGIALENLAEMSKIPLKITELAIITENLEKGLQPIQHFIQNHSKYLKYLKVNRGTFREEVTNVSTLNFENMENLEKLDLNGCKNEFTACDFEVNLGLAPLLKEIKIKDTNFNFESVPSLISLTIDSDPACDYLNKIRSQLIVQNIKLEKLSLISCDDLVEYTEEGKYHKATPINKLILSQAKNLKQLKIEDLARLKGLRFPKMEKLKRLELKMYYGLEKLKLHHTQFPHLEFLDLNSYLHAKSYGSKGVCMKNVQELILDYKSCKDFKKSGLKFPKLRKLHLNNNSMSEKDCDLISELLPFIFKHMTHVEELYIQGGFTWKEFTGVYSVEIPDFLNTTNILNTSVPHLGDMTVLRSLKLGTGRDFETFKAIPYLISCGKLSNLNYFEARVAETHKELISPFLEIFESNIKT